MTSAEVCIHYSRSEASVGSGRCSSYRLAARPASTRIVLKISKPKRLATISCRECYLGVGHIMRTELLPESWLSGIATRRSRLIGRIVARNASTEVAVKKSRCESGTSRNILPMPPFFALAHVLLPHDATAFADQSAERTCHRAHHRQTRAPWMEHAARAHA